MITAVIFAAAFLSPQPALPPEARVIAHGGQCRITSARQVLVTSEAEWDKLWAESGVRGERPSVDFARESVVAVFAGTRPTAGFEIAIVGVRQDDGATVVEYREQSPSRDLITAQVLTAPFAMVAMPRPAGPVRFQRVQEK